MTVTALPARNEITSGAAQTVFNFTFLIFDEDELNVYLTPVGQTANDATDLLTLNVDYTVDPAAVSNPNGGDITLTVPANLNDLITIVSNIPEDRTVDYQNNGDFLPEVVNDDFDKTVALVKQQEDATGRTLSFQQSQQNVGNITIAQPAPNQILSWNNTGDEVISVNNPSTSSYFLAISNNDSLGGEAIDSGPLLTTAVDLAEGRYFARFMFAFATSTVGDTVRVTFNGMSKGELVWDFDGQSSPAGRRLFNQNSSQGTIFRDIVSSGGDLYIEGEIVLDVLDSDGALSLQIEQTVGTGLTVNSNEGLSIISMPIDVAAP